jgi:hypothetical protein
MSADTGGKFPQSFKSEDGNSYRIEEVTELYAHLPAIISEPGSHWFRMTGQDADGNTVSRDFGSHGGATFTNDDASPSDLDTQLIVNSRLLDKDVKLSKVRASRFKEVAPIEEVPQATIPQDSNQRENAPKPAKPPVKATEVTEKPKPSTNDKATEKV